MSSQLLDVCAACGHDAAHHKDGYGACLEDEHCGCPYEGMHYCPCPSYIVRTRPIQRRTVGRGSI